MKEVRAKILGLKVFAYIVEEARGSNSNFKILVCSPLGWLSGRASLKFTWFNYSHYEWSWQIKELGLPDLLKRKTLENNTTQSCIKGSASWDKSG